MIRQEAKQAKRKVKPNRHVLCINIGIFIGNEINRELLPTSGIRAGLSAITPAFVLPYLFQAAWLPAHRQCAFLLPQPGHALFSFKRLFEVTG